MRVSLNDNWMLRREGREYPCAVPCSMYDTLIRSGEIPDPYIGENEWSSTPLSDTDVEFERAVILTPEILQADQLILRFEGIDTLADLFWDGELLGSADNMHRTWEFPLQKNTGEGEHLLRLHMHSPTRYVAEKQAERPLWGVDQAVAGYPHLRKAHSSFGWDWGPRLPDMGIWRDVTLEAVRGGRILSAFYRQRHEENAVTLLCSAEATPGYSLRWEVFSPDGKTFQAMLENGQGEIRIPDPMLWWVHGLGDQPLYRCRLSLMSGEQALDVREERIGLRTLTVSREKDEWGEQFCFVNNGIRFFAMGADWIPEDQIMPGCRGKTIPRLADCAAANFNLIRVWGGGYYPGQEFYDFCDEHGIVVWQDFMFACATYRLTPAFEQTVREEIRDNVIRLRNHASLGLWCGNNEIESAWADWGLPEDPEAKADYLKLFEGIIPEILAKDDPETFYWPSSPSSGGGFREPSSNRAGDMHYWDVWHNFKPIEAFRQYYYRFCSEYGFESLPDLKTVRFFAEEKDWDVCGAVMEAHQKCTQGTEKLLYYLGQMVNYPCDFPRLVYCSQLVQADCIRSNVEHMRRARGRCMGSAYWQVNDSNPVISWSSIDYFGRWKGLHYAAKKFYAPILLSCDDTDPLHPVMFVINDTRREEALKIVCRLRDRSGRILRAFYSDITAPALSAKPWLTMDLASDLNSRRALRTRYLEYTLERGEEIISGGVTLFVRPKSFDFLPARIGVQAREEDGVFHLTLVSDCFAKSVCLSLREEDVVFSDNWLDLHGDRAVTVTARAPEGMKLESFLEQLEITSYCPSGIL